MNELENDQRWIILMRSQGNNTHLGLEIETEEYSSVDVAIKDVVNFLKETSKLIDERDSDEDES